MTRQKFQYGVRETLKWLIQVAATLEEMEYAREEVHQAYFCDHISSQKCDEYGEQLRSKMNTLLFRQAIAGATCHAELHAIEYQLFSLLDARDISEQAVGELVVKASLRLGEIDKGSTR